MSEFISLVIGLVVGVLGGGYGGYKLGARAKAKFDEIGAVVQKLVK